MKTIKPKAKSKKTNGRFGRVKFSNKEVVEAAGPDLSQLRKPIDISVSSLLEVTRLLEIGGEEVKTMLAYECDVVYECRVCRSLFRSLANFISHKRVYCREQFNVALCRKTRSDHIMPAETFIPNPETLEDGNCREDDNNRILRSQVVRKTSKKDLTSVVDMLQRKRNEDMNENLLEPVFGKSGLKGAFKIENCKASQQILLEAIDSTKTAVYQTATPRTVHTADLMKAQIIELQNMADRNTAILNPDGRSIDARELEKSDSPLQIYGSDDEDGVNADSMCARDLVCSVCNAKFATRKTLTYHMKSLHVSYRTCYPCPCCNRTFANTWSVYRHLFKLHRKTNEQVRKLRTQIQEKAFRKETTGAEDIEKENAFIESSGITESQSSNNTQEWMEHFELDLELQRCGGCGRRFDRRAALISHSQLCQKRIAACNEAAGGGGGNKSKRLSKTPSPSNVAEENSHSPKETRDRVVLTRAQSSRKKIPQKSKTQVAESSLVETKQAEMLPESTTNSELSIRVENVSRISAADWEMIGSDSTRTPSRRSSSPVSDVLMDQQHEQKSVSDEQSLAMNIPDSPEIIFTSIDEDRTVAISFGSKKRRVSLINNSKKLTNDSADNKSAQSSTGIEKQMCSPDHMTVMKNRIATIANLRKLQCLPCRKKFTSMTNLRRHMAVHIGWHRYRCKLCDFKCFVKCDCVAHCNKVHDAQNNRSVIADMVIQIPPDESALAKEIMMDIANSYPANSEPELIDVTDSSPKSNDPIEVGESSTSESPQKIEKIKNESVEERGTDSEKGDSEVERSPKKEKEEEKKEAAKSDVEENSNPAQGRLDNDPDLRKMVMEVIFGTTEGSESRSDFGESSGGSGVKVKSPEVEESVEKGGKDVIEPENSKSRADFNAESKLEDIKRQRPTRNRVKPVNEDFIYDLTELIRKESAIHRASTVTSQKTLKKKQQQQQQTTSENEGNGGVEVKTESETNEIPKLSPVSKLPNILSHKRGGEYNGYNGKLSTLKQVEIRLSPTNGILPGKSVSSTKMSVSSQK